jgi:hypothetical protein
VWKCGSVEVAILVQNSQRKEDIYSVIIKVKKQNYEKDDLIIYGFDDCFGSLWTGKASQPT